MSYYFLTALSRKTSFAKSFHHYSIISAGSRSYSPFSSSTTATAAASTTASSTLSTLSSPSLTTTHRPFLDLVSQHGSGEVHFNIIKPKNNEIQYPGKVIEIVLNNPKKRNSICGKMMNDLARIVDHLTLSSDITNDEDIVALVIRGNGQEAFSAGADFNLAQTILTTPERGLMMSQCMTDVLNQIRNLPLITLACINGYAVGGGAELTTISDFRIMESSHHIQFVHARLGASPGWGGARRLTEIMGRKEAIRLLLSSPKITAEHALEIGYVDKIIRHETPLTDDDWHEISLQFLQPYLIMPYPKSIRAIKTAIGGVESKSVKEAIQLEQAVFHARWGSADNTHALAKAAEKAHQHHQDELKHKHSS